jgi:hypothetical protein
MEHKLLTYMLIMLGINVVLALAQIGISSVNPDAENIYNTTGAPANRFIYNNDFSSGMSVSGDMADLETSDSVTEGGLTYTDNTKTTKGFIKKIDSGLGLITGVLFQPYRFLKEIGAPIPIATAFGILWFVILTFLIVSFIKGGEAN